MRSKGQQAEQFACRYLQRQGLTLIAQNYQIRSGEIDLIMRDGETLVFIEVRSKRNCHFGTPEETIDINKQQRIVLTAEYYCQQQDLAPDLPIRFDAVAINGTEVLWIKDAFECIT